MKILSKRQILLLHSALITQTGGLDGVRDEGLLESAIHAPFQTFAEKDLYPTVLEKAARLGFGLILFPSVSGWEQAHWNARDAFVSGRQSDLSVLYG